MAYSNVRTWLVEQMEAVMPPGYVYLPWDTGFTPSARTVMFYRSSVVRTPEAPTSGSYTNTITLYVASPLQTGPDALDDLDDALDDVLVALATMRNVTFQSATYQVLNDTVPCFQVLVNITTNITSEEDS